MRGSAFVHTMPVCAAPLELPSQLDGNQVALQTNRVDQVAEVRRASELINATVLELENLAQANLADSRRDAWKFWSLKIPAMVTAAGSAVLAYITSPRLTAISASVGSFCVLLDGVIGAGTLRKIHYAAFLNLRILENEAHERWINGLLKKEDATELASKILDRIAREKKKIANTLMQGETAK